MPVDVQYTTFFCPFLLTVTLFWSIVSEYVYCWLIDTCLYYSSDIRDAILFWPNTWHSTYILIPRCHSLIPVDTIHCDVSSFDALLPIDAIRCVPVCHKIHYYSLLWYDDTYWYSVPDDDITWWCIIVWCVLHLPIHFDTFYMIHSIITFVIFWCLTSIIHFITVVMPAGGICDVI